MSSDKVERRERFGRRRGGAARRGKTVRKDDARNLAVLRITKHSVADFVWDQDWTPKISTPQELKDNTVFLNIARTFVRRRSAPTSENTLVEIRIVELESVKHLHAPSVLTFCLSPEGKRVLPTDLTEHVWIEVETKPQKSKSALFPEKQRGDKYWFSTDLAQPDCLTGSLCSIWLSPQWIAVDLLLNRVLAEKQKSSSRLQPDALL